MAGNWTGVYLTHRFGETLHNNHHAYPRSAKLNYTPNSYDLSYWLIQQLAKMGLAWNILVPEREA